MREDLLIELENEYAIQRTENEKEENSRRERIKREYPDIQELVVERENLIFNSLRKIFDGNAKIEKLPERMELISNQIHKKLIEKGLSGDYLAPIYKCSICKDTGKTGDTIKEPCICLKKAYQQKLRSAIGLSTNIRETFETFNLNVFPDKVIPGSKYTQRYMMSVNREDCEKWANEYPKAQYRDVLLTGSTGLGKTFLLHAIAERLIDRNFNVLIISAFTMIDLLRKAYFENDHSADDLLDVDVLLIDDLGSEPLMQNVTIEQLYYIINERQNRNLSTVISTNLDMARFRERYSERIASRIKNSNCLQIHLVGDDIRTGGSLKA